MAYDAVGLIYYAWKKNGKINSVSDFIFKNKIKGKIGTFTFKDKKVIQDLDIYKDAGYNSVAKVLAMSEADFLNLDGLL